MRKQFIAPEALIRSLRCNFENIKDPFQAINSIRRKVSKLPEGSLFVLHDGGYVGFYERIEKKKRYLKKDSDRIYLLARKRYLTELMKVLKTLSYGIVESIEFEQVYGILADLIHDFSKGNLDLARIAFTPVQYKWFVGKYRRKEFFADENTAQLWTGYGVRVRSKSEQSIGNVFWDFAVP